MLEREGESGVGGLGGRWERKMLYEHAKKGQNTSTLMHVNHKSVQNKVFLQNESINKNPLVILYTHSNDGFLCVKNAIIQQ